MGSPCYCYGHSQASKTLARTLWHLIERNNQGQEGSHTNIQMDLGHHPQTCERSHLSAITHVEPPLCPGSEQRGIMLQVSDICSECSPERPLKLHLLAGAQTQCPKILCFRSQCCECKPGVPHAPLHHCCQHTATDQCTLHLLSDRALACCVAHPWHR